MACINIDESWWTDPRREKLAQLLGDELKADGAAIRLWRLAQTYWWKHTQQQSNETPTTSNEGPTIPNEVFEHVRYSLELVRCGLAVVGESGVYVRGSSKQFEWITKQKQKASKAGKKSAQRPRNSKGQLQRRPNNSPTELQQVTNEGPTTSNETQPFTSSLSLPLSLPSSSSLGVNNETKVSTPKFSTKLWDAYAEGIEKKYQGRPERNAKSNSQVVAFLKQVPEEEALGVLTHYLNHTNLYYSSTMHNLGPMVQDAGKLLLEVRSGRLAPERYGNGKAPNGKWLTQDEKRRQNTISAANELIAEIGGGDFNG